MEREASASPDPPIGAIIGEKYRIAGRIGEGGMGTVYEGEHTLIERRVAIKVFAYLRSSTLVAREISCAPPR